MTPVGAMLLDAAISSAEAEATLLALLVEATESRSTDIRVQGITAKIERLERQQDRLRQLIATVKERQRRRQELEKIRKQNAAATAPTKTEAKAKPSRDDAVFRDERGRVIGYRHQWGNADVFLNAGGKLAGREVAGMTLDSGGKLKGWGRQGVRLVGTTQNSGKPSLKGRRR